jgi:hypothetical protein
VLTTLSAVRTLEMSAKESPEPSFETAISYDSNLFHIPLELREKIYHYLWCDTRLSDIEEDYCKFSLTYLESNSSPKSTQNGLPNWLLTNKQVLSEGMQQFYRNATCTSIKATANREDVCSSPLKILSLYRIRRIDSKAPHYGIDIDVVLDPCNDSRLFAQQLDSSVNEFRMTNLKTPPQSVSPPTNSFEELVSAPIIFLIPCWDDVDDLGPHWTLDGGDNEVVLGTLIRHFKAPVTHALKELSLGFDIGGYLFGEDLLDELYRLDLEDIDNMGVDFSLLEQLDVGLDRVIFYFDVSIACGGLCRYQSDLNLFVRFQEEMARVAKLLVGSSFILKDRIVQLDDQYARWMLEVCSCKGKNSRGSISCLGVESFRHCFVKCVDFHRFWRD